MLSLMNYNATVLAVARKLHEQYTDLFGRPRTKCVQMKKILLIQMPAKKSSKESSFPLTRITKKTGQLAETISFHKLPTTS